MKEVGKDVMSSDGGTTQKKWTVENDTCRICSARVNRMDVSTRMPCCNALFHLHCFAKPGSRRWVKTSKGIICPRCNDPKVINTELVITYETQRSTNKETAEKEFSLLSAETVKEELRRLASHLKDLKSRRAVRKNKRKAYFAALSELFNSIEDNDTLESSLESWKEDNNMDLFRLLKTVQIDFDSLRGLNFSILTIRKYMAHSWEQLVHLGFQLSALMRMSDEETRQLIGLFDIDVVRLRTTFGNFGDGGLSLKTLKDLRLSPKILALIGIDAHELFCMGLDKNTIGQFCQISMNEWVEILRFGLVHAAALDIKGQSDLKKSIPPWNFAYLCTLLNLKPKQIRFYKIREHKVVPGEVNYASPKPRTSEKHSRPKKNNKKKTGSNGRGTSSNTPLNANAKPFDAAFASRRFKHPMYPISHPMPHPIAHGFTHGPAYVVSPYANMYAPGVVHFPMESPVSGTKRSIPSGVDTFSYNGVHIQETDDNTSE